MLRSLINSIATPTGRYSNMWYLKDIRLQNFMGYRDITFTFIDDTFKPVYLIFAPNGSGKTSLLQAINLVYNSPRLIDRDNSLLLKKLVFNEDYDTYQFIKEKEGLSSVYNMNILAHLVNRSSGEIGTVEYNNFGVVQTCLDRAGYAYYIDADNPINTSKFQVAVQDGEKFLSLAKIIYNFDCNFVKHNEELVRSIWDDAEYLHTLDFYNDFVINKYGVKVHYKSFSGGEKKLATMIAHLCDSNYINQASVVVIDSFEKEIYYKRQTRALDQMITTFPDKQFFIVTHSETLISHVAQTYGDRCLYDIENYKKQDLGIDHYIN